MGCQKRKGKENRKVKGKNNRKKKGGAFTEHLLLPYTILGVFSCDVSYFESFFLIPVYSTSL